MTATNASRKKILLVDDDRAHLQITAILLKGAGFDVIAAVDAVGAIGTAVKEKPDLMILDLGLPAGDGFVVLERLRMNLSLVGLPVIVVSARDASRNRDAVIAAGASA